MEIIDMNEPKIDKTEIMLLNSLQLNCRRGLQDVADTIGSSASSLWRRLKNLEQTGIIERYSILINHRKLGIKETVFLRVRLDRHEEENIKKFTALVKKSEFILECYATTGDYDYLLKIIAVDIRQFHRFLEDTLLKQDYIRNTNTLIILDSLKENTPISVDILNM